MRREYAIIAAPLITEKGTFVNEVGNQVVFEVRPTRTSSRSSAPSSSSSR